MANVTVTADDDYIIHIASGEGTNTPPGWKFVVRNNASPIKTLLSVNSFGTMHVGRIIGDGIIVIKNTSTGDIVRFDRATTSQVIVRSDGTTDAGYAGAQIRAATTNPASPVNGDCFWLSSGGSHSLRIRYGGGWADLATTLC